MRKCQSFVKALQKFIFLKIPGNTNHNFCGKAIQGCTFLNHLAKTNVNFSSKLSKNAASYEHVTIDITSVPAGADVRYPGLNP